jgi:hypothetical protein
MELEHYIIFVPGWIAVTCGFFVGNAAGKFGKRSL